MIIFYLKICKYIVYITYLNIYTLLTQINKYKCVCVTERHKIVGTKK